MKTTRTTTSNATAEPITEDQMRASFESYVEAHCAIAKIESDTQAQIEVIKATAQKAAQDHVKKLAASELICKSWALANQERFTEDARKMEVYGGHRLGFQTCPESVEYIKPTGGKGKQTEKGFLAACKAVGKWAVDFIRKVEETNKDQILTWRATIARDAAARNRPNLLNEADEKLARLGVRVQSKVNFVIDLNLQPDAVAARA